MSLSHVTGGFLSVPAPSGLLIVTVVPQYGSNREQMYLVLKPGNKLAFLYFRFPHPDLCTFLTVLLVNTSL